VTAAIGIELSAATARVVSVDRHGQLLESTSFQGTDAAAALKAATAPMKQSAATPLGIATDDPTLAPPGTSRKGSRSLRQVVCHPGDAAVFAESWAGAAKGARHVVCLWLGNRVLAGVLLGGKPWHGAHGLAGSAAWLALNPVERQDYKKYGSFAAEVNDHGIAWRLAWRVQAGDESSVAREGDAFETLTAADVFAGARGADGVAISVARDTARYIAMAAVNLAIAVDPEVVVIAGPITSAADLLIEHTLQDFARRLPPPMVGQVRCEFSPLGEDGIAIGAARIAMLAKR
jgi:predicted NBD/HSP70 family sugar kinase